MALVLWAGAAVSESRFFSQPALLVAAWVAVFTLPPAYAMCRCRSLQAADVQQSAASHWCNGTGMGSVI